MNNFKDWCNKNPGYLTFWTLLCGFSGIIITIILSNKVEINTKGLLTFLNFKIPIPLYILLLSIGIISIAVYRNRKRVDEFIANELEINSDNQTLFLESITYPDIPKNLPTQVCNRTSWINHSRKFPVLSKAQWISHSFLITEREAIDGGIYILQREFEFNSSPKKVKNASLHFLVDDYCRLFVNGKIVNNIQGLERSSSYSYLHSFEIKDYLMLGKNNLKFEIENCNFHDLMKPNTPFYKSQDKGNHNPYGIIFTMKIVLNKPST